MGSRIKDDSTCLRHYARMAAVSVMAALTERSPRQERKAALLAA